MAQSQSDSRKATTQLFPNANFMVSGTVLCDTIFHTPETFSCKSGQCFPSDATQLFHVSNLLRERALSWAEAC